MEIPLIWLLVKKLEDVCSFHVCLTHTHSLQSFEYLTLISDTISPQHDAGDWKPPRLVRSPPLPGLLQDLQRPHPHHEGPRLLSILFDVMARMVKMYRKEIT